MAQVGRISGPLLEANLQRDNDLAFETDLLYFDISNNRVGIKNNAPTHDIDIIGTTRDTNTIASTSVLFDNIYFNANGTITSYTGPLRIQPQGVDPYLDFNRLSTDKLTLKGNLIKNYESPNGDIVLESGAASNVIFDENTTVQGNLSVIGNILVNGNLSSVDNIRVGDSILDVVVIETNFTQDILPGQDNIWNLGIDANDSVERLWNNAFIINAYFDVPPTVNQVAVSDQLYLDGISNTITTLQSNDNLLINSNTGIIELESLRFQNNTITNLESNDLTFSSTGLGYLKFTGTGGFVIPSGTVAERPLSWGVDEAGGTRWNTELGRLESWDGSIWITSTGPGIEITDDQMEELGYIYTFILG